jgi:hypothetical protein
MGKTGCFSSNEAILVKCCGCDVRLVAFRDKEAQVVAGSADGFPL